MRELIDEYFNVIIETLVMAAFVGVILKVTLEFLTISV